MERVKIGWNEDKSDQREQGVLVVVQVGKNAKESDGFRRLTVKIWAILRLTVNTFNLHFSIPQSLFAQFF